MDSQHAPRGHGVCGGTDSCFARGGHAVAVVVALLLAGCTGDTPAPSASATGRSSQDQRQPSSDSQQVELQRLIEAYRLAHRTFHEVVVDWRATEEAFEDAERALQDSHERILTFIEKDVDATADAFREATAAQTEEDRLLWMNFIHTLVGLGIISEAHHEAREDALANVDVIAEFHTLYPEAQGTFVYYRGDLRDVWWESAAVLHGRYQLDLAVPVVLAQDGRRVLETGEPEFTLHEYDDAGDPAELAQFGPETWEKIKAAQGRIEDVLEQIITGDPVDVNRGLIELYERILAETDDESERAGIRFLIDTLGSADEIAAASAAAAEHAIEHIDVIREFHETYPEASSSFGRFAVGWAYPDEVIPWRSEVVLHGRYELTMELNVGLSEDGRRIVRTEEPTFYLNERRWVQRLPDGRLSIAYDPTHVPQRFGSDAWRRLAAADGDLSVLGFDVVTDDPIEESPDPAPQIWFPAQPVDP